MPGRYKSIEIQAIDRMNENYCLWTLPAKTGRWLETCRLPRLGKQLGRNEIKIYHKRRLNYAKRRRKDYVENISQKN